MKKPIQRAQALATVRKMEILAARDEEPDTEICAHLNGRLDPVLVPPLEARVRTELGDEEWERLRALRPAVVDATRPEKMERLAESIKQQLREKEPGRERGDPPANIIDPREALKGQTKPGVAPSGFAGRSSVLLRAAKPPEQRAGLAHDLPSDGTVKVSQLTNDPAAAPFADCELIEIKSGVAHFMVPEGLTVLFNGTPYRAGDTFREVAAVLKRKAVMCREDEELGPTLEFIP